MTYNPLDSAIAPAHDAGAAAMSGAEFPQSKFSQEFTGTDLSQAHQIFQPADGGGALSGKVLSGLNGLDISGISASPLSGTEAMAMMPPTGTGLEAGLLSNVAGAGEISPMIQMILKMPGAMGLVTSVFEFFANFFLSPTGIFDLLNPTMWAQHAVAMFHQSATHISSMSFSMLPGNAPILSSLTNLGQPMFGSDLLSAKLNLSLGNSSYSSLAKDVFQTNGLNVSSDLAPSTAVFESGAGSGTAVGGVPNGHLSGPSLTDVGQSNHIAGNTRLFSDRMTSGGSFNSMNLAAKSPSPVAGTGAPNLSQGLNNSALSQGFNSGASTGAGSFLNNVRFEGTPQVANLKTNFVPHAGQEVSYNLAPQAAPQDVGYGAMNATPNMDSVSYGPSGYVGNELGGASGGNQQLLAMDQPTQSFKPTLSGQDSQLRSAFPTGAQSSMSQGAGQPALTGLKAKQLSLGDSLTSEPVAQSTPANAASKLGNASGSKVADAAPKSAYDSAKAIHKAPAHDAPKVHHEAPKHVSHKVEHAAARAKVAEAPKPEAQPQTDVNQMGLADGTVADGTQIAQSDAAAATQYVVQKGDNLWNIAKDHLGAGAKWQDIYKLNESLIGQNPDLIYPGTTIQLPGGAPEIASTGSTTMTNYVVKPGDNLWDISKEMLGDGTKWGDIYQANQDIIGANPRLIHPGQEFKIPSADPSAGGTVATNTIDPNAAIDPNAMAGQQPVSSGTAISAGNDSIKSMQAGGTGTEFGATTEQYLPQTQAAPQQVSSYPEADLVSSNAGFQPTVQGRGLPVIPANSTPIEAGPGSAMAATLHHGPFDAANAAAAAAKGNAPVVSGGVFAEMKNLFAKNK